MGKYKGDVVTASNFVGGTYNGVTIESHADRHLPNGADPIATAIPSTLGTSNSSGTANSLVRSDHVHDHGAQTTPNHHAVSTTSANGFMSSTDKTKLDGVSTGATANATDADLRARASHTGTQTASTISDFSTATLGVLLTGLSLLSATPIIATDSLLSAVGKLQKQITDLSTSKYDVSNPNGYETPSQLTSRDTNNRARANHTGTQTSSTISDFGTTVLGTLLAGLSTGTSIIIATSDSVVGALGKLQAQINAAYVSVTAQTIGTTNAAGTATTFARTDHVHAHGDQTSETLHAIATQALNGFMSAEDKLKSDKVNRIFKTSANQSSSSNTVNTNVTDLTINCVAGVSYAFKMLLKVSSAATGTGPSIALTGTSVGVLSAHARFNTAATTASANSINALNTNVVYTGVAVTNTDYPIEISGIWTCTTSGTFLPAFRSETNGTAVQLKQYSFVEWAES